MKKINIFTVFLITLAAVLSIFSPSASALRDPSVIADTALMVESGTGRILYEKEKDTRVSPGSITTVMTLLLAVEAIEDGKARLSDPVRASRTAVAAADKSAHTQKIAEEETILLQDLMYCAYLAQAGDACNIIAERLGGSIGAFTAAMNKRAAALGCKETHFTDPDGTGTAAKGAYTTAWDQYLIFREAVGHQLFLGIAGTLTYKTKASDMSPARIVENANLMQNPKSRYYEKSCVAGKTDAAGTTSYSCVSCAKAQDMTLITVVFGAGSIQNADGSTEILSYTETKRLFEWAFTGYAWQTLAYKGETAATVVVEHSRGDGSLELMTSNAIIALLTTDLKTHSLRRDVVVYGRSEGEKPTAPISKGQILGEMTVYLDGIALGKVKLIAARDVALDQKEYIKTEISKTLSHFWVKAVIALLVLLVAGYVYLVIRDLKKRIERKRMIAETKKRLIAERKKHVLREQRLDEAVERVKTYKQD
jgi:D-alanyl-D-alanine carboxypeptidase (penicillin-binding protein 5/6)